MLRALNGKTPKIHPKAYVNEMAYVIGDVEIGEGSSVWPCAVVRGDSGKITIGKFTNIQDNSVLHGDADMDIGDYVTIGHGVVCHARRVGDWAVLSNGCSINNFVEVGDSSIVGSGAVVPDRVVIPPRSLAVGVPARVTGEITERHIELIKYFNRVYSERTKLYKSEKTLE